MPIYGYQRRVADEKYGLLEMKEVSFNCPSSDLRKVAEFFVNCANALDDGTWRHSHLHMRGAPEGVDIIVLCPSTNTSSQTTQ